MATVTRTRDPRYRLKESATATKDWQSSLDTEYLYPTMNEREIRLLTIYPSDELDQPVQCCLQTVSVAVSRQEQPYITLSYAWGPSYAGGSHLKEVISCDGCKIRVTAHLLQALKRIREGLSCKSLPFSHNRLSEEPMKFWIDAICINQMDAQERGAQVAQMNRIYSMSQGVLIWLGELSESEKHLHQAGGPAHFALFQILLKRSWFRRRWVIQEIAKAENAQLLVSDVVIDTTQSASNRALKESLSKSLSCDPALNIRRRRKLDVVNPCGLPTLAHKALDSMLSAGPREGRASSSLLRQLQRYDDYHCSDDRDRIFALLSLGNPCGFKADYTMSCDTVYEKFARDLISHQQGLGVLACAGSRPHARSAQSLPSWVPDWRIRVSHRCEALEYGRPYVAGNGGSLFAVRGKYLFATGRVYQHCKAHFGCRDGACLKCRLLDAAHWPQKPMEGSVRKFALEMYNWLQRIIADDQVACVMAARALAVDIPIWDTNWDTAAWKNQLVVALVLKPILGGPNTRDPPPYQLVKCDVLQEQTIDSLEALRATETGVCIV